MKKWKFYSLTTAILAAVLLLLFGSLETMAAEAGWERIGESWHYVREGGTRPASQWEWIEGRWYHFDDGGSMETGWYRSPDANWYFLHADGAMAVGWVYLEEHWYYFSTDGVMYTGWLELEGEWYYLGMDGKMLADAKTPDGYTVDDQGRWRGGLPADAQKRGPGSGSSGGNHGNSPSVGSSSSGNNGSGWSHTSAGQDTKEEEAITDTNHQIKEESGTDKAPIEEQGGQGPSSSDGDEDDLSQAEEKVLSISGQEAEEVLNRMLLRGKLFQALDQEAAEAFANKAVAAGEEEVILIGKGFFPFSLTLNRLEYDEIDAIQVERLQCITQEGTYCIRIYYLVYAHKHRMAVTKSPAYCTSWGIWENACELCGEIGESCYLPPKGHSDEDGDLICDDCGEICEEILDGCRQTVECAIGGQRKKMTFICIDEDYENGSLFLASDVIPYGQSARYALEKSDYGESEIRNWLNNGFFSTLSIASHILPVQLEECRDDFDDRVFCLSKEEIRRYANVSMKPWTEKMGQKLYWSRTADGKDYAYGVSAGGHLVSEKVDSINGGIRPAYVLEKPSFHKNVVRVWLEGERQLRHVEGKEYRFTCVNPDYRGERGCRGALFLGTEECGQEEYQWMRKSLQNDAGILEWLFWEKEGKHYPAFIAEQR